MSRGAKIALLGVFGIAQLGLLTLAWRGFEARRGAGARAPAAPAPAGPGAATPAEAPPGEPPRAEAPPPSEASLRDDLEARVRRYREVLAVTDVLLHTIRLDRSRTEGRSTLDELPATFRPDELIKELRAVQRLASEVPAAIELDREMAAWAGLVADDLPTWVAALPLATAAEAPPGAVAADLPALAARFALASRRVRSLLPRRPPADPWDAAVAACRAAEDVLAFADPAVNLDALRRAGRDCVRATLSADEGSAGEPPARRYDLAELREALLEYGGHALSLADHHERWGGAFGALLPLHGSSVVRADRRRRGDR